MLNKFFLKKKAKNVKFLRYEVKNEINRKFFYRLKKKLVSSFSIAIIGFGNDGHIASIFKKMNNFSSIVNSKKCLK